MKVATLASVTSVWPLELKEKCKGDSCVPLV
jgi:hypothetical protein